MGAKSRSHVPLPKTGIAFQKQVTKKNATVGLKESASNNGASKVLPVKPKSSNLSSRHSMTGLNKLAVTKTSVSNNNIPKTITGGNTGARPKILRNSQRSSSSLKPPTNQSEACIISSLSNETAMGASRVIKSKIIASNSCNDAEVSTRPRLPQRSLSNLSLKS